MVKTIDLTGKQYGLLTVVRQAEDHIRNDGKKEAMWICKCNCKKQSTKTVRGTDLKTGHTHSCGCLSIAKRIQTGKKNHYITDGDIVKVNLTNCDKIMICDNDIWEKYRDRCWSMNENGYARATKDGSNIFMHRLVIEESDKNIYTDHINGNRLDNRRKNLRLVTPSQSMMNTCLRLKSTTGIKGVSFDKRMQKYEAYIHKGKKISLGFYKDIDEARTIRGNAERELYGEYGCMVSRGGDANGS